MSIEIIVEHPRLNKQVEERKMKIQKLFRDSLQLFTHTSIVQKDTGVEIIECPSLTELHQKAEKVQEKFDVILSNAMEQNRLPQYLNKLLQDWKSEVQDILMEYDSIISQLNCGLEYQDRKYREKAEIHCTEQGIIRDRIENLITELNKAGREEVNATRDMIIAHSKHVSDELWKQNETLLNDASADKPFDPYLWKTSSEILTQQELENIFIVDRTDIFNLRRGLLSEVCKLRTKIENDKLSCILERQSLEQEIFCLKQKYNSAIPTMAEMKRKYSKIRDKKETLGKELKILKQKIEKELLLRTYYSEMRSQNPQRILKDKQNQRTLKVFNLQKAEVQDLLAEILISENLVYETILAFKKTSPLLENFSIPKNIQISEMQYWNSFLNFAPNIIFLNKIFDSLWIYREQLQLCCELLNKNLNLSNHSKELKILLKQYHKMDK